MNSIITPLIPRADLFGNPVRAGAQISPDGEWLAWIAPVDGINNIWVAPRHAVDEARPITDDALRGINGFNWCYDSMHILFAKDRDGDEQWHVHAVHRVTGEARDLTPIAGARANVVGLSRFERGTAVIQINDRDASFADLYRLDIATGERTLLQHNPGYAGFLFDDHFRVYLAFDPRSDGSLALLRPDGEAGWREWIHFDADDARVSGPVGLDADATTMFLLDSRGRDTAALVAIDLASDAISLIAEHDRADIGGFISDRKTYRPLAYSVTVERSETIVLDPVIAPDVAHLDAADIGRWGIMSRSEDDRWWTVGGGSDVRPGVCYLYDRADKTLAMLYETRPALTGTPLVRMHHFTLPARDGLPLVCYLSLPAGQERTGDPVAAAQPLPLVLLVHGGPWTRDGFGYNPEHQWLANRGYAVLSVNFRGSTGFGKRFLAAGDREWGGRMDDDLDDAVNWAVAAGIADPAKLAIMGGSYGGYAVLSGLTRTPTRYVCGVDIVGPSNLETLMAAIPPHWESERATLYRSVGDPTTEEGRALLHDRSPQHRAAAIERPLLIAQGANDPRVPQAESDQMVAAMRANGVPVTYVLYPDEGHGFVRPVNDASFRAISEQFLARWMGGRAEPVRADEIEGASFTLEEGADWLAPILPARTPA